MGDNIDLEPGLFNGVFMLLMSQYSGLSDSATSQSVCSLSTYNPQ